MQTPSNMQYPSYLGHSRPLEDLKMTLKPLSSITLQVSDSIFLRSLLVDCCLALNHFGTDALILRYKGVAVLPPCQLGNMSFSGASKMTAGVGSYSPRREA